MAPITTTLKDQVDRHEVKIDAMDAQLRAHDTLLMGIPDCPGLMLRVKTLETSIGKIEDAIIGINAYMKIIAFISGAVGVSIIGFMFAIVTHSIEVVR